jgi:hypothetical protein
MSHEMKKGRPWERACFSPASRQLRMSPSGVTLVIGICWRSDRRPMQRPGPQSARLGPPGVHDCQEFEIDVPQWHKAIRGSVALMLTPCQRDDPMRLFEDPHRLIQVRDADDDVIDLERHVPIMPRMAIDLSG